MTDRYGNAPDDEPIIGGTYPPPRDTPDEEGYIGGYPPPARPQWDAPAGHEDDGYADDEYDDDDYDDEWDDGYDQDPYVYDEPPARQPMFYVFIALAALVGGIVIFLLFSLLGGGDDSDGGTKFGLEIDSPANDARIEIGVEEPVAVQATATDAIVRFELFLGDRVVDSLEFTEQPADNRYIGRLRLVLDTKGTYEIFVRVTASSGETEDSDKVRVLAVEPVGERPQTIRGTVVADATLRIGPGEQFAEAGRVRAGDEVTILGKSRDVTWLLVESAGDAGRWVRRAAIEPLDTLDLVPIRDVTPTPGPTATDTPEPSPSPSPSPSASPSPGADAPDFEPTNAVLVDGGSLLRVTVSNRSNAPYSGPVVVAVGGDVAVQESAVGAEMEANGGSVTIEFAVDPPITSQNQRALVTVDPSNAVRELREDNNQATFVLLPAEEPPVITIQSAQVTATTIDVTIQNAGGALPASQIEVRVTLGGQATSNTVSIALASGQASSPIQVTRPAGAGQATVSVLVDGEPVATAQVELTP